MTERQEGEPIAGTAVRCVIRSDQTDGRFSVLTGELGPRSLIVPHTHAREDELSFVHEGRIGARVGDRDAVVEAGGSCSDRAGCRTPYGIPRMSWRSPLSSSRQEALSAFSRS